MGSADGGHRRGAERDFSVDRAFSYPVLVPNIKGLEAARAAGVDEIAVFGAASETFSRRNINCSIEESLERFRPVVAEARSKGVRYALCLLRGRLPL